MTTEQLSSNKKTWAELAEEEDDEIENCQFTTNSETLDKNEIPHQPTLTKSISEFQPKTRNDKQKNNKQRDNDSSGLKSYKQNNSNFNKGINKQNRQTKSNYDDVYNILFETTNQEILLKIRPINRNENLETVKEYFEKHYQNIKAFPRNDINQVDLLISPKIGLYILDDHRFKTQIGDSILTIQYPQFPNEPLSEYYAKKRYLEKEKKLIQSAPVFQRNAISSKSNDQNEKYENDSKQDINNFDKIVNDQPQIYKEKDNLEDQQYEQNNLSNKSKYEKKDFNNKQTNYKNRKYNNNYYEYEEDCREYKEEKQLNYKSNKYRNEQHQPKENYQQQKYFQNDNYKYTDKAISENNQAPYQEKEQNKDYRNNQNYQNQKIINNNNHYNQKRQYKGNNKQKDDQYVIYEEKQKSNYDKTTNNMTTNDSDNFERQEEVPQNINQPIQQRIVNEDKNEDNQIDSDQEQEQEQEQEQIEENKTPNKNKKKKKNKKNLKTLKPNDTNFFGILQSGTK